MNKLDRLLKISAIIGILLVGISVFYYFVLHLPNKQTKTVTTTSTKQDTKETNLRNRFKAFTDMIVVNLCQQAYDEFITENSKQVKGYEGFLAHCNYRQKDWSYFDIQNVVFSGETRADVKYSYDLTMPDRDSKKYKDCLERNSDSSGWPSLSSFQFCESIAPTKIEKRDTLETWLFEEGKWKRDY